MVEFKLKKGYDIKIAGKADYRLENLSGPKKVAVLPSEFPGLKARLQVKEGDQVKRGTVLFHDKRIPAICVVSPVSGVIKQINRGQRRRLEEIVIENDQQDQAESFGSWSAEDLEKLSRAEIKEAMLKGGIWPLIKRRPFSKVANPEETPRDIFISAMDTHPLAADPNYLLQSEEENFQKGLNILGKLTDGKVHLALDGRTANRAPAFEKATGVEKYLFSGPHPAGNVGVQIHHISPIKGGELVWTLSAYAVALIGKFFSDGRYPAERLVAVAGSSLIDRRYIKTVCGAPVSALIPENNIKDTDVRYISGNVLTGRKILARGYSSYYENLITVIPEGRKERKLIGYFRPGLKTPSFSKTFLSNWLAPAKKDYEMDTLMHGGQRAIVMSASDYEAVVPMDILPVPLIKSIMAEDIEEMEALGIMELDEEDLALCSYICLSKTDFGHWLRKGLDLIEREG